MVEKLETKIHVLFEVLSVNMDEEITIHIKNIQLNVS
jgi:hypothetical protein